MSTPVGSVQAVNAHKGVKRSVLGNPVGVPHQLPGFRGRVVDAGGPIKAPKLRNGNLNNQTSNVRIPYSRVCPLEFLSSYQGRLGPGDLVFSHKYPPGFMSSRPYANNATLGVNTLSRVVGLDGLNRILMGSGPNGWRLGDNVYDASNNAADGAYGVLSSTDGVYALTALNEYRLDGVVISNDEPGSFTSSGTRDNALFNVAIQGPVETNNGFLMYEAPIGTSQKYNPLTGVTNTRTVEAHARGSVESGMHIDPVQLIPGRVGSTYNQSRGKVDFVSNFCGTYAMYPSQMFDRRVESLNMLYVGLRAYKLSADAKKQLTTSTGAKYFPNGTPDWQINAAPMYFYQYLPFSSRVASVIQDVSDKELKITKDAIAKENNIEQSEVAEFQIVAYALRKSEQEKIDSRAKAAKKLGSHVSRQQTASGLPEAPFDNATYDPIRSEDMWNMVGAWTLGRVLDTKAAVHERYVGGPRDAAFSCIVDVGISWRAAQAVKISGDESPLPAGFLLDPSQRDGRGGQQDTTCLANNITPPLAHAIGPDFGSSVRPAGTEETFRMADAWKLSKESRENEVRFAEIKLAQSLNPKSSLKDVEAFQVASRDTVRNAIQKSTSSEVFEILNDSSFGTDPMVVVRKMITDISGIFIDISQDYEAESTSAWSKFMQKRNAVAGKILDATASETESDAFYTELRESKSEWQQKAEEEIYQMLRSATPPLTKSNWNDINLFDINWEELFDQTKGPKDELQARIREFVVGMNDAKNAVKDSVGNIDTSDSAVHAMNVLVSAFINRINVYAVLFGKIMSVIGYTYNYTGPEIFIHQDKFKLLTPGITIDKALGDREVLDQIIHFSSMCDVYEKYYPVDKMYFSSVAKPIALVPGQSRARAVATATEPAAVRTGAAVNNPVVPSVKPPTKSRTKTPVRTRAPAPVTASAAPTRQSVQPVQPVAPNAAAGMSSNPLVPTQAAMAVVDPMAPRRRAREATASGESITDSLFENMFKSPADTGSNAEEPASPTPSSGSEGPSVGPRTFRRQR